MDADWTTARAGDATFVSVVLRVDRPRRVRVTNELDGPAADRPDGGGADRAADPAGDASTAGGSDPRFGSESLDAMEERVGRAEALAGADTLPAATAAVEDAGGLAAVRELAARLDDDAAALARIERRARALRERVRSTEVPVETLERLA
jgi:hypothetical protein